ncbi:MAG: nucleoside-diphosphate kinase [Clostridia bacterium]|nr:nucleoside-diphosphate kinase [Clostridia bacterium]
MLERSYVMVKPEFANNPLVVQEVKKQLVEKSNNSLTILKGEYINYTSEAAKKHYAEHVGKDFYPDLEGYITSDKAYGMIVEGENAIATIRSIVGATKNPAEGTIRFEIPKMLGWPLRITQNVVHASDSSLSAEKEIEIFENIVSTSTDYMSR